MGRLGFRGALAILWLSACGELREDDDGGVSVSASVTAPSSMTASAETMGPEPSDSSGAPASSSDDGMDMVKLDVGAGAGMTNAGEGGDAPGCDKVDFLFIIDNSGSMEDEQSNLIASFPQFIETIEATLDEAQDYHIMVIDSDAWVYSQCELLCAFGTCLVNPQYQCGITVPLECEDVLGAGVTHPRGAQATNADCAFASGARYMTSNEPDLTGTFECAARVGVGSTDDPEKPMEAMVAAVTPGTPAWDCNESFLRDDAILVVTFISDEDDDASDGSGGTVEGWRQALISAKGGDETAMVVLGLFGDNDSNGSICPPLDPDSTSGAEPSPRLRQFVESWGERGVAGSVCADSYQQFFQDAVAVIDTTCDEFVPPAG